MKPIRMKVERKVEKHGCISPVVAGGDALSIWSRGAVVEVDAVGPVGLLGARAQPGLLGLLDAGGADTDHPDEQDQQDDEDDGPGDAPGDVGKLRLGLAVLAGEGSSALAEGDAQLVLDADALVLAAAGAGVGAVARLPGPEVAGLALAVVPAHKLG